MPNRNKYLDTPPLIAVIHGFDRQKDVHVILSVPPGTLLYKNDNHDGVLLRSFIVSQTSWCPYCIFVGYLHQCYDELQRIADLGQPLGRLCIVDYYGKEELPL